jgi:hypothetical protein
MCQFPLWCICYVHDGKSSDTLTRDDTTIIYSLMPAAIHKYRSHLLETSEIEYEQVWSCLYYCGNDGIR